MGASIPSAELTPPVTFSAHPRNRALEATSRAMRWLVVVLRGIRSRPAVLAAPTRVVARLCPSTEMEVLA